MKILHSRKGFTLIELLVVIGILAVLAAIAIPSVAGLIDRANASADATNANEYTNAMERFVSEYELFRQDIASGTFNKDNMDAAQGRVYNVTGADDMNDIRALESKEGLNGIRIDIDSKYAQNLTTVKAVISNYTKTNSDTFNPKQSDKTYWYNTLTGYTVIANKDIDTANLYKLLPSYANYCNSQDAVLGDWIDLSANIAVPNIRMTHFWKEDYHSDSKPEWRGKKCVTIRYSYEGIPVDANLRPNVYFLLADANKINIETESFNKQTASGHKKIDLITIDENKGYTDVHFVLLFDEIPDELYTRICFEYEENGQIKYIYSPIAIVDYNQLHNYDRIANA